MMDTQSTELLADGSGIGLAERTLRKVRWRILPMMMLLYVICYIDRTNVGFAKAGLARDVGIGDAAYGLAAGIFFVGYVLFEVPSSGGMVRFGARKWLPLIVICWGVFATAMALITGATSFNVLRFLLGVAEAGFFPAVLFYFTLWFPVAQRLVVVGIFTVAQPVANALGATASGFILNLDGAWGLHGWQWLFIIEGAPAIALGITAGFLLTNHPEQATWLRPEERAWLVQAMHAEHAEKSSRSNHPFLAGLKNRNAWIYGVIFMGLGCGLYGLTLWLPIIVNALGTFSHTELGLLVAIPYLVSAPCVYLWAKRAGRTARPAWHSSVSLAVAAVGLMGAGLLLEVSPVFAFVLLCGAAGGLYSTIAPLLSMPAGLFAGAASAASLTVVVSLANVGGFIAPYVVGLIKEATGSHRVGLVFLAACVVVTSLCTYLYAHRRPEGDAGVEPHGRVVAVGSRSGPSAAG
jgi:ACS family tartrate transporter-like MFS transporter